MSLDVILIALAVVVGVGYFAVRTRRKQAEIRKRL
jgi:hypothetical protein